MADTDISLAYTTPFQLTKRLHREPYEYVSPEKPENSQKSKIIVIIGGSSGIGTERHISLNPKAIMTNSLQAAAEVWVRAGAEGVVIAGRRAERLEEVAASLRALSKQYQNFRCQGRRYRREGRRVFVQADPRDVQQAG
jgi:hypothetical protein